MQDNSITPWLEEIQANWLPLLVQYGKHIVFALITLAIGWWLIGRIVSSLGHFMDKRHADPMVTGFLSSLLNALLRVLLLLSVAGMVGIETTSFIALIGAAVLLIYVGVKAFQWVRKALS